MKNLILLGQFNRNVGSKYQSLLQEEGVDVVIEDWSNSLEVAAGYSLVRLLVPVQDYQRSLKLIDDFEDSASKRLKESDDKAVGKELLKTVTGIVISALITIGIIFVLLYIYRIYTLKIGKKFFEGAVVESKRGNFLQAIKDYTKSLDIYPFSSSAYYDRGLAYYKSGNFNYAIADFYKAIEIEPNYSKAYSVLGLALYKLGNLKQAIADCTIAIKLDPNYESAYVNRGIIYAKQGDLTEAMSDYNKAIELNPEFINAIYDRGIVYRKQGKYTQAITDFTKTIEINPKHAGSYEGLAYVYFYMKEYDKAWAELHKAEILGYKQDKEDLELFAQLKKASGRDQ